MRLSNYYRQISRLKANNFVVDSTYCRRRSIAIAIAETPSALSFSLFLSLHCIYIRLSTLRKIFSPNKLKLRIPNTSSVHPFFWKHCPFLYAKITKNASDTKSLLHCLLKYIVSNSMFLTFNKNIYLIWPTCNPVILVLCHFDFIFVNFV